MKYLKSFNESLNSSVLTKEQFINILTTKCKKFIKSLQTYPDSSLILRKDEMRGDFVLVDPKNSSSLRVEPYSANDIHNLLVSNLESWKGWPRRNRSLCCASEARALAHGSGFVKGKPTNYVVIPFDDTEVAICDQDDFWKSFGKLPKHRGKRDSLPYYIDSLLRDLGCFTDEYDKTPFTQISNGVDSYGKEFSKEITIPGRWNRVIRPIGIDKNWSVLESFLEIAKLDEKLIHKYFTVNRQVIWNDNLTLLGNLNVILDPIYNNFKLGDVMTVIELFSELDPEENEALECWFEDEALMVRMELFYSLSNELNLE
jgi:hypothetical protein